MTVMRGWFGHPVRKALWAKHQAGAWGRVLALQAPASGWCGGWTREMDSVCVPVGSSEKAALILLRGSDLTGKVTFEMCDLVSLYCALGIFL